MERYWWSYTFEPVGRNVTVICWRQRGNLAPERYEVYDELTWAEAVDVMEMASWALVERLAGLRD